MHLLLLDGVLLFFHKEGEKYILKYFQLASNDLLAPIIKLSHLIVRPNAASKYLIKISCSYIIVNMEILLAVKDSLFLINVTIKQMYNLKGRDPTETKR